MSDPTTEAGRHQWERFDTLLHRCLRCGWGWKWDADNEFPCPGFDMATAAYNIALADAEAAVEAAALNHGIRPTEFTTAIRSLHPKESV